MFVIFTVGSLRNSDDDGSEDIAKKNEFVSFQTSSRHFGPVQFLKLR